MKKGNKIVLTKISGNLLQADLVNILKFLAGQMAYHTCHVWMDPGLPINKKQVLHTGACDQKIHRHIYIYTNFLFLCPSLPFMDNSFLNALSGTRYVGRSCLGQGGVVVRRCHRKAAQVWGVRVHAERGEDSCLGMSCIEYYMLSRVKRVHSSWKIIKYSIMCLYMDISLSCHIGYY